MEIVRLVLLFLHVLGFAALVGGLLVQLREPTRRVTWLVRDGSGTAFVAGLLLVGVLEAGDEPVDRAKIAVKLLVGLVVLVLAMTNLRKERVSDAVYGTMLALSVLNVAVAIFWAPVHT